MQTKLTLRLDDTLIGRAKAEARRTGKSVSQLVAEYFALLSATHGGSEEPLPPQVRALKGVLRGTAVDVEDYHQYLADKHR